MNIRYSMIALTGAAGLSLGACAGNYAGEGALGGAAAGAAIGAVSGGNPVTGAAIGAAAGGVGGSLIRRDGNCFRVDSRGRERRVRC